MRRYRICDLFLFEKESGCGYEKGSHSLVQPDKGTDMVNEYSIGIHDFINEKIETVTGLMRAAEDRDDLPEERFFEGQIEELHAFRKYMNQHIDLKTQQYK